MHLAGCPEGSGAGKWLRVVWRKFRERGRSPAGRTRLCAWLRLPQGDLLGSDTEAFGQGELKKVVLLGSKCILNVFCVAFLPFPSVALCFSNQC